MTVSGEPSGCGRCGAGGFTLVELLVAIGIAGILAAIAIQAFSGYRQRAHDARAMHDVGTAIAAEEAYYGLNMRYVAVPTVVGPRTLDSPGMVVSDQVELTITVPEETRFEVRTKALLGTGVTFVYDSETAVISQE